MLTITAAPHEMGCYAARLIFVLLIILINSLQGHFGPLGVGFSRLSFFVKFGVRHPPRGQNGSKMILPMFCSITNHFEKCEQNHLVHACAANNREITNELLPSCYCPVVIAR